MSESPQAVSSRPAVSAHDCFVTHFCNQVLKTDKNLTITEIRKMAAERWKGMTLAEKRPYKEIAATAQQREELGLEMPAGATMKVETSRKRKRAGGKPAKDPNAPKRATTAFFFYSQEQRPKIREEHPEYKITEVSKLLGQMWRDLSEKEKEKYTMLAEKDKKRYEEERAAYERRGSQGSADDEED